MRTDVRLKRGPTGRPPTETGPTGNDLLELDRGAGGLELLLELLGVVLRHAFLDGLRRASTRSLASLRPRPVIARTSLMTLIFLSPAAIRMTVNSVCASAAGAAAAPPAAATATGAAAETPHFSSSILLSSAASRTVSFDSRRPAFPDQPLCISCNPNFVERDVDTLEPHAAFAPSSLAPYAPNDTSDLTGGCRQHAGDLRRRSLEQTDDLAAQLIERRQRGERLDASDVQSLLAQCPPTMVSFSFSLAKAADDLRRGDRILGVGDGRRALEQGPSAVNFVPSRARSVSRFFATL